MKKWLWLVAAVLVALLAWTAIGPYRTFSAIRDAAQARDAQAMAEQIDFPALRNSLKAQLGDRLLREVGAPSPDNPFAAFGLGIANGLVGGLVDAMVTPAGLGAMMEGRRTWDRASGTPPPSRDDTHDPSAECPLHDAQYRYESLSRFTATVHDDRGRPVVFVMTRRGLDWKLSDIRLPLRADETPTTSPTP
ncbi:DUF2939 domain-containing protein [Luteimonas soli]|uniref:DUF2939 domain-containing protein n=1 Tax=Luteimonas soli TaxID=1648966 RepID=A0ABV7XL00_9GAMM